MIRVDSGTVANIAVTLACGMFVALGGLRLFQNLNGPREQPVADRRNLDSGIDVVQASIPVDRSNTIGPATAPLTIVEFSDFECPFCARHALSTFDQLKREYIDTGQVRYAFKHFPLAKHPNAPKASEAAECAAQQGRFWTMHRQLFANQRALAIDALATYAKAVALDTAIFKSCLEGQTSEVIGRDKTEGIRLGVTSTPSFFIGLSGRQGVTAVRKISGARPIDTFRAVLNEIRPEQSSYTKSQQTSKKEGL